MTFAVIMSTEVLAGILGCANWNLLRKCYLSVCIKMVSVHFLLLRSHEDLLKMVLELMPEPVVHGHF